MTDIETKIRKIRELLDDLENEAISSEDSVLLRNFDALELPRLASQIVDFLQPNLFPYEAAIYWHLFRHSVVAHGQQSIRVSTRGLREGVVLSRSGTSESLSLDTVRKTLTALENKGVISKMGEPNREGTLYKVFLPEEIDLCRSSMELQKSAESVPVSEETEQDYYNVHENRLKVFERDNYKCRYCDKQLTQLDATLDHIQPVSEGGDNSLDNLTTSCLHCNSRRGARSVMEVL